MTTATTTATTDREFARRLAVDLDPAHDGVADVRVNNLRIEKAKSSAHIDILGDRLANADEDERHALLDKMLEHVEVVIGEARRLVEHYEGLVERIDDHRYGGC